MLEDCFRCVIQWILLAKFLGMVIGRYDGEFAGSGEAVIDQDNLKTFCGHKV
ncbi:hypothetical protein HanHA300_Chr12g0439171 [Helianthus annuus]|nr:hypothetical protein HanHA300_Chr12g0439171 [Helianthus annuus]KAJ0492674.1 hypothetical protein HanIR_Chr12g0577521 [Helianthus annuus]KAJ0504880.1 hypothetical protein HanHA89_Chr12g0464191 [Helianthus annuus]KAJ0674577.1 hypothetical protein HanLR1_Chr12g0441481 [Helianthus annuus]